MKPLSRSFMLLVLGVAACGAPATVATRPVPAATSAPAVLPAQPALAVSQVPPVTMSEPPRNWQLLDESNDHIPGISAERAMNELLKGRTPKRTVLVAIIDNGIDTAHVDLRANLWTNPSTGLHGWNFIGGRDGQDVNFDTFEVTRQHARCHNQAAASGAPPITDADQCKQIDTDYDKQRQTIEREVASYRQVSDMYGKIVPVLEAAAKVNTVDSLTADRVRAITPTAPDVTQARQVFLELAGEGASPSVIKDGLESLEGQLKYSLNPDYNPRTIVGDNYTDLTQRQYGNSDVMGPDAKHGTHVAGIIGAVRGNGIGVDGIAPAVKFMMIRTVPNGDERDKDVANAIRLAADNGAQIISMSFGKAYSPYKSDVDDAVKYADSKGVLMVHAAGNDGADLAKGKNFPTPNYIGGGHPRNWIEVGASSWKGGDKLAADFSNYGQQEVDVFAPGVDILSTVPGDRYERDSGTSMAAPVVSGVAALLMSYFPNLNATDIKSVIMGSVMKLPNQSVIEPGTPDQKVPFGRLSVAGGIVNAYNAVKMAEDLSNGKVRP
jgi:subtilisin family serine protease